MNAPMQWYLIVQMYEGGGGRGVDWVFGGGSFEGWGLTTEVIFRK